MAVLAVVIAYPVLRAVYLSFQDDAGLNEETGRFESGGFAGFQHYLMWLTGDCGTGAGSCPDGNLGSDFWQAVGITFFFAVVTVAIEVGMVLASFLFMHRMAEATAIEKGVSLIERDQDDFSAPGRTAYAARDELPKGVEVFELRGPLFFGAASRLTDAFEASFPSPKAFILRFGGVPMIDVSGVGALSRFLKRCETHGTQVLMSELNPSARLVLEQMGVLSLANVEVFERYEDALRRAGGIVRSGGAP